MSDAGGGRQLLRSSSVVAAGTLLSRVTGLVRTVLLAIVLGLGVVSDAYNLANTTPNLLYDLLLGGILSATLVPVLVANLEADDEDGTHAVLTVATVVLVAITAVALLFAPAIIRLYAATARVGGAPPSAEAEALAADLLRLFAPQILFYGLTALATAVLNSHRRFAAAAFAPVLNNLVMFAVLFVAWRMIDGQLTVDQVRSDPTLLWVLGAGTTAGIVAMALALWPALRGAGIALRWRWDLHDPSIRRVARLSGWTLGYVIANQVTLLVIFSLAWSGASEEGAVSAWGYAYQFFQLPYGVFTVSVMTAFTPELASLVSRGDQAGYNERLLLGLRTVVLVILPSSLVFLLLARPIVGLLFEHGSQFDPQDAALTAEGLAGFAVGMVGFSLYLYVLRGFYAMQDTRTPFFVNLFENGVNLVLAVVFVRVAGWGLGGLALAWSVAYLVSAALAWHLLHRRMGHLGRPAVVTTRALARMVVGALVMAVVIAVVRAVLPTVEEGGSLLLTVLGVGLGGAAYAGVLVALRVPEVRELPRLLRRG